MEDKVAEEKTGVKDGTTRDGDDIPVSTCVGVAAGTGGVLDEEVNGKHQVGTDGEGKNLGWQWREGLEKLNEH